VLTLFTVFVGFWRGIKLFKFEHFSFDAPCAGRYHRRCFSCSI